MKDDKLHESFAVSIKYNNLMYWVEGVAAYTYQVVNHKGRVDSYGVHEQDFFNYKVNGAEDITIFRVFYYNEFENEEIMIDLEANKSLVCNSFKETVMKELFD